MYEGLQQLRAFAETISPDCPINESQDPISAARERNAHLLLDEGIPTQVVLHVDNPAPYKIDEGRLADETMDPERILACLEIIRAGQCSIFRIESQL
ncbi:MAG: hypothetical protein ACXWLH_06400 [Candidatus Saccharimonadales bacterium]